MILRFNIHGRLHIMRSVLLYIEVFLLYLKQTTNMSVLYL